MAIKLQQLRFIAEVHKQNLNVTAAAEKLHTSQPGISKQVRLLEEELGVKIFERSGKHIAKVTPMGEQVLERANRILAEVGSIQAVAAEYRDQQRGELTLATTHTQARYALPPAIQAFRRRYPEVQLNIQQGTPPQIAELAATGGADFAIATEAMEQFSELVMMPCYHWNRCVITPPDHPLAQALSAGEALTLETLAQYPIITYVFGFTGRSKLDKAFVVRGLKHDVVLTAVDADVIKTYVRLGLGVGILANMAYDPTTDQDLVRIPADHLFEPSTTNIGFRRGTFLRGYMYDFIRLFAPHLGADVVDHVQQLREVDERKAYAKSLWGQLPKW